MNKHSFFKGRTQIGLFSFVLVFPCVLFLVNQSILSRQ